MAEELKRNGVIPPRSAEAGPEQVDLSNYYTAALQDDWLVTAGANLAPVPTGLQTFAGTTFDVRGLIQLAGQNLYKETEMEGAERDAYYPEAVEGIAVGQKAARLQFLHATCWKADPGTEIGAYTVHYADGEAVRIPLKYMHSLKDWWIRPGEEDVTDAEIAWAGQSEAARRMYGSNLLFKYTWENPRPEVEVAALDFFSTMTTASPFLIALTVEPS